MKKFDAKRIPELLGSGKIGTDQAATLLWGEVYANPGLYGLGAMDEDERSDFLLFFHGRFSHIIREFDSGKGDFTTFIRACMTNFRATWKKASVKKAAEEKALSYALEKGEVACSPLFDDRSDPARMKIGEADEISGILKRFAVNGARGNRTMREMRETMLILAMKACADLDDGSIQKLSVFLQKSEDEIHSLVEKLKGGLSERQEKREKILRRRDSSFFKKRKFSIELENLDESSAEYGRVSERLETQKRSFERNSSLLARRYMMSPRNEEIAKILGISSRKVYYCISHAKEKKNLENLQQIFRETEDDIGKNEKN